MLAGGGETPVVELVEVARDAVAAAGGHDDVAIRCRRPRERIRARLVLPGEALVYRKRRAVQADLEARSLEIGNSPAQAGFVLHRPRGRDRVDGSGHQDQDQELVPGPGPGRVAAFARRSVVASSITAIA